MTVQSEDRGFETPCHIWTGRAHGGYGYAGSQPVHRMAYEAKHGPVPEGFHVHHRCQVPLCVNPAHLEALSPGDHRRAHLTPMPPELYEELRSGAAAYRARSATLETARKRLHDEVRNAARAGISKTLIAKEAGLSRQHVYDLLRGGSR